MRGRSQATARRQKLQSPSTKTTVFPLKGVISLIENGFQLSVFRRYANTKPLRLAREL